VSLILPRVRANFDVDPQTGAILPTSMFVGMFAGALFWGSFSDKFGRRHAFNYTLVVSALAGFLAAVMPNFWSLCFAIFIVGFGVGGHM